MRHLINETDHEVINIDKLTYASNLASIKNIAVNTRYKFEKIDICKLVKLEKVFANYMPDGIIHLAAESHVDRSIDSPEVFIKTNIIGTYNLLEVSRKYWNSLNEEKKASFRFHHVSTDEVYGDLHGTEDFFTESTSYAPSSPYSASKASSDHLVRAWHRTYNLPVLITNCSNNYGPYQHREKLIPLIILNALAGKKLPVYGDGKQIRDWLYVDDHARALYKVFVEGKVGETYNIGGCNEMKNIDVVKITCSILDEIFPNKHSLSSYLELITYVQDRPGHDARYAINAEKIKRELGWEPIVNFDTGIRKTVEWFLGEK